MDNEKRFSAKDFWLGTAVGLLCTALIALICIGLYVTLGNGENILINRPETTPDDNVSGISEDLDYDSLLDKETVQKLDDIATLFREYSIYDIDEEKLRRGVIDGLVAGSGDRYAEYYTEEELNDLFTEYEGTFYGIGALLSMGAETKLPTITRVYADSPAEKAGLKADDIISAVDGVDVSGMTLDEVVSMIRGEQYTDVVITVFRPMISDYLDITVTRDKIETETVASWMLTDEIGYIQIMSFDEVTVSQFDAALKARKADNMKALVLDLRSNPGGLLGSVVDIGRQILPKGIIVYTEDVFGERVDYTSDGRTPLDIPIVILTNGYTASASEILTGALKGYDMATTLGTKTYGKGVVQIFTTFSDGSGMKLTTEKYYTPDGICIDGEGFAPDIEVPYDPDSYDGTQFGTDNQIEAAIEELEKQLR